MVLPLMGFIPTSGSVLTAQSPDRASDSVSPSLSSPPLLTLCLSLSLSKINIKKIESLSFFLIPEVHGFSLVQIQSYTSIAYLSLPFVSLQKGIPSLHSYAAHFISPIFQPHSYGLPIYPCGPLETSLSLCSPDSWNSKSSVLNTAVFEGQGNFRSPYFYTMLISLSPATFGGSAFLAQSQCATLSPFLFLFLSFLRENGSLPSRAFLSPNSPLCTMYLPSSVAQVLFILFYFILFYFFIFYFLFFNI